MKNNFKDIYEIHCFEKDSFRKNKDFQFSFKRMYCNFSNFKEMDILCRGFLSNTGFQIAQLFVII